MAIAAGRPAAPAVREALPGWARQRVGVEIDGGRLTVRLRPPSPLGGARAPPRGQLLGLGAEARGRMSARGPLAEPATRSAPGAARPWCSPPTSARRGAVWPSRRRSASRWRSRSRRARRRECCSPSLEPSAGGVRPCSPRPRPASSRRGFARPASSGWPHAAGSAGSGFAATEEALGDLPRVLEAVPAAVAGDRAPAGAAVAAGPRAAWPAAARGAASRRPSKPTGRWRRWRWPSCASGGCRPGRRATARPGRLAPRCGRPGGRRRRRQARRPARPRPGSDGPARLPRSGARRC